MIAQVQLLGIVHFGSVRKHLLKMCLDRAGERTLWRLHMKRAGIVLAVLMLGAGVAVAKDAKALKGVPAAMSDNELDHIVAGGNGPKTPDPGKGVGSNGGTGFLANDGMCRYKNGVAGNGNN